MRALDICRLSAAYAEGETTPSAVVEEILAAIEARGQDGVWITVAPAQRLLDRARELEAMSPEKRRDLTLWGIPFAVKDNIDVAGLPTTAGCPEFAYVPERSATVVERLEDAGAIPIGKTNLDQFATGLVGTRSPYGIAQNPFDGAFVPGGSSSGSAVAVAVGLVSFALGTDTAGSGRVPAAFNNVVGVKPTRGLVSLRGVVPACLSLDCVSIFALTPEDGQSVLDAASGYDPVDPWSRPPSRTAASALPAAFAFAVPREPWFFTDGADDVFTSAVDTLQRLGGRPITVDFTPFEEAAKLLYGGPWIAERYAAIKDFITRAPEALHPVTRGIIEGATRYSAVDAFEASYRLRKLIRDTAPIWEQADVMVTPTTGGLVTCAEVAEEPVRRNIDLGHYTNYVNLMDLAAIAVPAGFLGADSVAPGMPLGITLTAPAFSDGALLELAMRFHSALGLPPGATGPGKPPTD